MQTETYAPRYDHDTWDRVLNRFVDWANFLGISPREAFHKANEIFSSDHFGIESITLEGTNNEDEAASMEYLNEGETYATTLVLTDDYTNGVALIVSSWGDWYEEVENHYNEENGTIRCGYCSHLTPKSDPYEDTVCDNCNHKYN